MRSATILPHTGTTAFRNRLMAVAALTGLALSPAALAQAANGSGPVEAVSASHTAATKALTRAEIDALLGKPDGVLVLDVRRPEEISANGGFPAYLNIQITELDRLLSFIPKDRSVLTVSNHAKRAQKAGDLLAAHGFKVSGAAGAQDYETEGGVLSGKLLKASAIPGVIAADTRIEVLREGFDGTEGPVATQDGAILFIENRADRIVRIGGEGAGPSEFLKGTASANSLALGPDGRLFAVTTAPAGVAEISSDGKIKPLADRYKGKAFNRPNDLVRSQTGQIYFTDPGPGLQPGQPAGPTAVYRLDTRGRVHLIADDIRRPNGITLSPDEKTLYIANTGGEHIIAYTVKSDGGVTDRRDFATLAGFRETETGPNSGADGLAVDAEGRLYVASSAGLQIFSPGGEALGVIALPRSPQNLAFGGTDRSQLYAVGRGSVYRIATVTRGAERPGK